MFTSDSFEILQFDYCFCHVFKFSVTLGNLCFSAEKIFAPDLEMVLH